jgi:hypothetical protein
MKLIVYNNEENKVSIVIPATLDFSIKEVGEKSIKKDIPFWVVESTDLPTTPQETWELENMGKPSGTGKAI